jgi:hypothetical protein
MSWFINGKWFDIKHFLSCILFLAFSNAWDQVLAAAGAAAAAAAAAAAMRE